jgi:hypothetical protein
MNAKSPSKTNSSILSEKEFLDTYQQLMLKVTSFDTMFLDENVPLSKTVSHSQWAQHLSSIANLPGKRVLELGSREVTGKTLMRSMFDKAAYTGFDIYPGPNVDVVGDAHRLSQFFKSNEKFDLIFSSACFEHFAMPWVVAMEIAKMLPVGGFVFVETHFSFSSHERPWHFFQFSDMALRALFPKALGFECIEAGLSNPMVGRSNPMVGRFSTFADDYLKYHYVNGLYCHSEYLGKKIADIPDFDWNKTTLNDIVGNTVYPQKSIPSSPAQ